jgi:hypothetical protein
VYFTNIFAPYNGSSYKDYILLNLTTSSNSSCNFSLDEGITNFSMNTDDNSTFYYNLTLLPQTNYSLNYYCSSLSGEINSSLFFHGVDHLTLYVDKDSSLCSDSFSRDKITNENTPACSINTGLSLINEPGDELVIKYGNYDDDIDTTLTGVNGTSLNPIIIRGESNALKTFLNGSLSVGTNGIDPSGNAWYIFRYFHIFNFSNDAMNVHGVSDGIVFENITADLNGYSQTSASGDGISFHEYSSGYSRYINVTNGYKSLIVDIANSTTNYTNVYGRNNRLYGIFFYGTGVGEGSIPNDLSLHYIWNATIEDSPSCFWSEVESHVENLICNNISGKGVYFANRNNSLKYFNISTTDGLSIKILNASNYLIDISDGQFNQNLSIINSSNVILTNVSYNISLEDIDSYSSLTRKWHYQAYVNYLDGSPVSGASVNIYDSTGNKLVTLNTNSSGYTSVYDIVDYIYSNGTREYNSVYSLVVTLSGFETQTHTYNSTFSNNLIDSFILTPSENSDSNSGGSSSITIPYWINTYVEDDKELDEKGEIIKELLARYRIKLKINDETHFVGILYINDSNIGINVSSMSQTAILSIHETKKFEVTGDNIYDLSVSLNSINFSSRKANISIKAIFEDVVFESENQEESSPNHLFSNSNKKVSKYFIFGIIIILIFILILFFYYKKPWKNRQ